jgi:hypothetical protein
MTQRTILLYLACLAAVLSCSNPMEDNKGGGEPPVLYEETYGEEIGTYYVENRNMTLRLMDITSLYQEVGYMSQAVPVNHVSFQNLPETLRETVKGYALGSPTQVYQMKWHRETVYHLICGMHDDITGVYKPSGERIVFSTMGEYFQFLQEVSDVKCLLLINPEVVKSAEGAPKLLEGTWQSDWLHLHHDIGGVNGSGIDDQVELYAELPFSITEVCHFKQDGTGYLRTVKTLKNGKEEVAYDPFNYWLTNYQSGPGAYKGYDYLCVFAAGDTIEYTARCHDDFSRVFDRGFVFVTYPWYKQRSDSFSGKKGDPKYGIPEKDGKSPIVGRWTGITKSAVRTFGIGSYTWVFRGDGTGYLLSGRRFCYSFAYTVDGQNGSDLQLTLYKYDTGFTIEDGFWKEGDWTYSYVPQPTPQGETMQAKIYDDDNRLEIQGWTNMAADFSTTPIVFQRVSR